MNPVTYLIFVLVVSLVSAQGYYTQTNSYYQLLNPARYISYEYSTRALDITYTVECTRVCNVYLVDHSNLLEFQGGRNFQAIQTALSVTSAANSYASTPVISNRVFVLITNRDTSFSSYATSKLTQTVPLDTTQSIIGIIISCLFLCCCCCICACCCGGIIYLIFQQRKKNQYSYINVPQQQQVYMGNQQPVFTQGYYSDQPNNPFFYPQQEGTFQPQNQNQQQNQYVPPQLNQGPQPNIIVL